ncbi:MAG: DUF1588 domain-containing protein [Planctomycetota bacterium]
MIDWLKRKRLNAPFRRCVMRSVLLTLGLIPLIGVTALGAEVLPGGLGFEQTVRPFMEDHCFKCHGPDKQKGDLRLDEKTEVISGLADAEMWEDVLDQLVFGEMPPSKEPTPPREKVDEVVSWIEHTLGRPSDVHRLKRLPGYGNYVDHELLFTMPQVSKAASPPRLWRISPHIFKEWVNTLAQRGLLVVKKNQGGDGMHPALPFTTPEHEFKDYAQSHGFEEATTELLMDMLWRVADFQIKARRPVKGLRAPLEVDRPGRAEYASAIKAQFRLVMQRAPEPEELSGLIDLALRTQRDAGVHEALQTVLTAVLLSAESVFRVEIGAGIPDEHGRVRLTDRQIAQALGYALTDAPPDAALRAALDRGDLSTREGVSSEVTRMLENDGLAKPRMLRFFQEYFEYTRAPDVFKAGRIIKHMLPRQMVDDADTLVMSVLAQDRDVFKTLLTTSDYFVNYGGPGKLAQERPDRRQQWYYEIYNLPRAWDAAQPQPVSLPKAQRSGMLTHPAWLLSFSDSEKNQAIQRGRWVRMKLLGGAVPDVPIGVNAQLPDDENLTLRQKMKVTRDEYCWRCHERMDDLGLPFEHYDDVGTFRTEELGKAVIASGLVESGVAEVDGAYSDPFEMLATLAESRHVQRVFVRHAFRFWMGRNETPDDAPTLIAADEAYEKSGGSMKALVKALLTSDSFLYRYAPGVVTAER